MSKFKLDSAFEDNFDFSAAKAELEPSANPFPAPPSSTTAVNGTHENGASSSAFGSPFAPASQANNAPITNGAALSFDDAFGSVSSGAPAQASAQLCRELSQLTVYAKKHANCVVLELLSRVVQQLLHLCPAHGQGV